VNTGSAVPNSSGRQCLSPDSPRLQQVPSEFDLAEPRFRSVVARKPKFPFRKFRATPDRTIPRCLGSYRHDLRAGESRRRSHETRDVDTLHREGSTFAPALSQCVRETRCLFMADSDVPDECRDHSAIGRDWRTPAVSAWVAVDASFQSSDRFLPSRPKVVAGECPLQRSQTWFGNPYDQCTSAIGGNSNVAWLAASHSLDVVHIRPRQ
jgi:hypothetical protein